VEQLGQIGVKRINARQNLVVVLDGRDSDPAAARQGVLF
jgi:hypothetical protein